MRKSKFSDEQIVAIVRESEREGVTVEQCAKKHGITPTTLFRWRKRFGGLEPNQAAELRQLQAENSRLKKVVRACALMQVSRSALRYRSTMPAKDAERAAELQRIAREHPTYGYRFAWGVIQKCWRVNRKRVRRLWRQLGLSITQRKKWQKIPRGLLAS